MTIIILIWVSALWGPILLQQKVEFIDLPSATTSFKPSPGGNMIPEPWRNPHWAFQAVTFQF